MTQMRPLMRSVHHGWMDDTTLRWFLSLCETQNMRDSAARLGVPQSTMSRAITRLEHEVGIGLFDRHGRSLRLNRFGELLRDHAARAVGELDLARRRLDEHLDPAQAVVRLGFLQSLGRWLVPRVVAAHRETAPATRFEMSQGLARDLFAKLRDDVIDAAVVTPPPAAEGDLRWVQLEEQQLCLAVPPDHPLARRARARVRDADGVPFVGFGPTTDLRHVVDELLADAGAEPVVAFQSAEIDTMRGLVRAGLGLSILPRPPRPDEDDPVYLPFVPRTTRRLGLAWCATSTHTPAVSRFLSTVPDRIAPPDEG